MSALDLDGLLDRNLTWIAAADSKVAPVMAIDTAMLGVLVALAPSPSAWSVAQGIFSAIAALLLFASLVCLGIAVFPRVDGPKGSLIYFAGIASRDVASFSKALRAVSEDGLHEDYAKQIHRNAQIAETKFGAVRAAMAGLFLSIVPWLVAVALLYG